MNFTLQLYDELYKAFQDNPNRLSCYTHREISKKSISESLLNIGSALDLIQDFDAAESKYKDALSLFNDLRESELIAITLNNLGIIHFKAEKYKLAEKEFNEALTIRRTLAQENPNVYLPFVIMTLNNLASLHKKNALNDKAEAEEKEISCMLNNINEQPKQCYWAMQYYNLARSYIEEDNISKAEAAAQESLYYFNQLASSQQEFNKDVQKVERMLIYIKQLKDSDKNYNNLE